MAELPDLQRAATPARVHLLSLALVAVFLVAEARRLWWGVDDWDFLQDRGVWHADVGIFEPHNEHWSTVPILIYRFTYSLVGLHHYLPYALWVIAAHLVLCHLLWRLLRRFGTAEWVATTLIAGFAFGAAGPDDAIAAFQSAWTLTLCFGIGALLVLDRSPLGLRGVALVWVLLVLALASSGVGVTVTVVSFTFMLWRRQFRDALLVVAVPLAVFVAWYRRFGHHGVDANNYGVNRGDATSVPSYVWSGLQHAIEAFVGVPGSGPVLLVLVAAVLARAGRDRSGGLAVVGATGAVVFFLIAALGRVSLGVGEASSSRYGYVAVALLLPAFALRLPGRPAVLAAVAALLVVQGVDGTVAYADGRVTALAPERASFAAAVALLRHGDTLATPQAAPTTEPNLLTAPLAAAVRRGEVSAGPVPPAVLATARAVLEITSGPGDAPATAPPARILPAPGQRVRRDGSCTVVSGLPNGVLGLRTGIRGGTATVTIGVSTTVAVRLRASGDPPDGSADAAGTPVTLGAGTATRITATAEGAIVFVLLPSGPVRVC